MNTSSFKEDRISQIPALQLLQKLGYTYLSPEEALELRGNKTTNVILEDVLRKQLHKINSIKVSSTRDAIFSDANIENGIVSLKELPLHQGYIAAAQWAYDRIVYGKALEQNIDGQKKSFTLRYIDWQNHENNVFHVTEEYSVMRTGSNEHYRPDIVLFVNGIPLCIIECKRPDMKDPVSQAISQHLRNQHEDGIRHLYAYSQLLLAVSTFQARYATTDTKEEFWSMWKEEKPRDFDFPVETEQDYYLAYLCEPNRFMELIEDHIIFEAGKFKKIARYQQFFALRKIINRIQQIDKGKRKGGVIWHTQGSGKSLTMAMLARKISKIIKNPKIVLVTDRVDLDTQITDTFGKAEVPVHNAKTGKNLVELLQSQSDAVVTTVINKFEAAVNQLRNTPLLSENIFVLIDEGHRTQYGTFNVKMQKVFPNACFLAFTGTPLMKKEKNTARKFGGIIDTYTILQAVEDKAIVPIIYEGRHTMQDVNQKALDKGFSVASEGLTDYQKADLKKKFSKAKLIEKTEQRIEEVARDISDHFEKNWGKDNKGEKSGFKGMVVTPDKLTAVKYKAAFDEIGKITTEVIMSSPDDREGYEDAYEDSSDEVVSFWKKMKSKYGNDFENGLIQQFKKTDYPDLLIVVHKLLTGFDEPRVVVMYVCKKLEGHTLLQAIARVNRVAPGKDYGFIIDYAGIIGQLDEAMHVYSNLEAFETEDIDGAFHDIRTLNEKLPQTFAELNAIFKELSKKLDVISYTNLLADESIRADFYSKFHNFSKYFKFALSSLEFENSTSEQDKERYKKHFKFYTSLRNTAINTFSDKIDFKQYEKQLQKLIDRHVTTEEIIQITEQVSILDADAFEKELEKVMGVRAKAETIASRTKKHITERMDEDPVFFKNLSELIRQTIEDMRSSRINEAIALKKLKELQQQAVTRKGDDIPEQIQERHDIIPLFRIARSAEKLTEEQCEIFASAADSIIKEHLVVDWKNKMDVVKKMNFFIGEYLIDEFDLSIEDAEDLAEKCVDIAKARIL